MKIRPNSSNKSKIRHSPYKLNFFEEKKQKTNDKSMRFFEETLFCSFFINMAENLVGIIHSEPCTNGLRWKEPCHDTFSLFIYLLCRNHILILYKKFCNYQRSKELGITSHKLYPIRMSLIQSWYRVLDYRLLTSSLSRSDSLNWVSLAIYD